MNHSFWADVAFITVTRSERSLEIQFKAASHKDAVKDALRFAHNRAKELGWQFSCLRVGRFWPEQILADGSYQEPSLPHFFEWKYDWPGTIEEMIEAFA